MWFSKTDFIWFNCAQINLSRLRLGMTLTRRNTGRGWCPSELSELWFIAVWHFLVISSVSLCASNCCLYIKEFIVIYKSFLVRCLQWKYDDWDTFGICNFIAEKKNPLSTYFTNEVALWCWENFLPHPFPLDSEETRRTSPCPFDCVKTHFPDMPACTSSSQDGALFSTTNLPTLCWKPVAPCPPAGETSL